jgi:hypothetical protein
MPNAQSTVALQARVLHHVNEPYIQLYTNVLRHVSDATLHAFTCCIQVLHSGQVLRYACKCAARNNSVAVYTYLRAEPRVWIVAYDGAVFGALSVRKAPVLATIHLAVVKK